MKDYYLSIRPVILASLIFAILLASVIFITKDNTQPKTTALPTLNTGNINYNLPSPIPTPSDSICGSLNENQNEGTIYVLQLYETSERQADNRDNNDSRICKVDLATGNKTVLMESTFKATNNQTVLMNDLYTIRSGSSSHKDDHYIYNGKIHQIGNKLYFLPYNPGSDNPNHSFYWLDLDTNKISKMTISQYTAGGSSLEVISPDGRYMVKTDEDEGNKILRLLDFSNDTATVMDEVKGEKGFYFSSGFCSQGDVKWIDNKKIEYHIYNLAGAKIENCPDDGQFDITKREIQTKIYTIK